MIWVSWWWLWVARPQMSLSLTSPPFRGALPAEMTSLLTSFRSLEEYSMDFFLWETPPPRLPSILRAHLSLSPGAEQS